MSLHRLACTTLLALAPLLVSAPAYAICTPSVSSGTVCLGAGDDTCAMLGTTVVDGDLKNLIACLGTALGNDCTHAQCRWKSMTSTGAATRSTFTPIAAATTFTNDTKNGDITYNYAIPASATHLKISTSCRTIGNNAYALAKAYFTPSAEPMTSTDPQFICAAYASSDSQSNQNREFELVPVPIGTTTFTIITQKDNNTYDRDIIISILPLNVE